MALTYSPALPVPGDVVTIAATVAGVNGNQVECASAELTLTAVPGGSTLATGLALDAASGLPSLSFTPDVPGVYSYDVQRFIEYTQTPGFDGGASTHTLALDTESGSVDVCTAMALPIVTPFGALTLSVVVGSDSDSIVDATLTGATTPKAELAALDATVLAKLAAIIDVSVATVGPALPTKVGALGIAMHAHFRDTGAHLVGDAINGYVDSPPYDIATAVQKLNRIRAAFVHHALDSTTSTINWHSADDTKNVPLVGPAGTVGEAIVLYADVFRCYSAHLGQVAAPASHPFADVTHTLGAIDPLSDLIKAVLAYLASATPTVPVAENQAQVEAISLYGFQEA